MGCTDVPPSVPPTVPDPTPPPPITECIISVSWTLPTERVDDTLLEPNELIAGTLYAWRIPENPDAALEYFVVMVDPYVLLWENIVIKPGLTFFELTVSNLQESARSNTITKEC